MTRKRYPDDTVAGCCRWTGEYPRSLHATARHSNVLKDAFSIYRYVPLTGVVSKAPAGGLHPNRSPLAAFTENDGIPPES
ncbi:MAG: hypothetical protein AAF219_10475 [Myxococcota bacterium]